jgi:hypothetical protein
MKRVRQAIATLILLGIASAIAYAATHSLTYTTAQDTGIQNRVIPAYNRQKCLRYGRAPGCSTANLASSGCVPISICTAAGLTVGSTDCNVLSTENVENCTIFTINSAGQDAYLKEVANRGIVQDYLSSKTQASADFKASFDLASQASKDHCCTDVGLGPTCDGP